MFFSIEFINDHQFKISGQEGRNFIHEVYEKNGVKYGIYSVSNPAFMDNNLYLRGSFTDMDFCRISVTKRHKKILFELMDAFNSKKRKEIILRNITPETFEVEADRTIPTSRSSDVGFSRPNYIRYVPSTSNAGWSTQDYPTTIGYDPYDESDEIDY